MGVKSDKKHIPISVPILNKNYSFKKINQIQLFGLLHAIRFIITSLLIQFLALGIPNILNIKKVSIVI